MLAIRNLSKHFGGLKALQDVSFEVGEHEVFGLIGPNGSGKTTLFNMITGFYPVTSGSIRFGDRELAGLKTYQINRLGIARTFQNIRLFGSMTVLENILVAQNCRAGAGISCLIPVCGKGEKELRSHAGDLLKKMGLWEKKNEKSTSLAYGEQRRLEIARALATNPAIILLDEPAAGMNDRETQQLLVVIEDIRTSGKSILLIEHDMNVIVPLCDRVAVLNFGRLIAHGTPGQVMTNVDVIEAYLGREEG